MPCAILKDVALPSAICTGTYLLARAGLLQGRRCTIHWENHDGLVEEFPDLDVTEDLFEIDEDRVTCSGIYFQRYDAAPDCPGPWQRTGGDSFEQFIHDRIRESHDRQRMELRSHRGQPSEAAGCRGRNGVDLEPLPQTEIARRTALSTRQLERLFRKYLNTTPTRYYLNLRIARARQLLRQTSMSILSVALACGFVSASHFSNAIVKPTAAHRVPNGHGLTCVGLTCGKFTRRRRFAKLINFPFH